VPLGPVLCLNILLIPKSHDADTALETCNSSRSTSWFYPYRFSTFGTALPEPHAEPLSDSAVTALFGPGDAARRTLINAWLDEGRTHMRTVPVDGVKRALLARLEYNVPVLSHLPEVCSIRLIMGSHGYLQMALGIWTSRVSETRYSAH
jgi:hypothetical protein